MEQPLHSDQHKKSETEEVGPLFGIVVIIILLAAGGVYFLVTQQQKAHTPAPDTQQQAHA